MTISKEAIEAAARAIAASKRSAPERSMTVIDRVWGSYMGMARDAITAALPHLASKDAEIERLKAENEQLWLVVDPADMIEPAPDPAEAITHEVKLEPGWLLRDVRRAAARMQPDHAESSYNNTSEKALDAAIKAHNVARMAEHGSRAAMRAALAAAIQVDVKPMKMHISRDRLYEKILSDPDLDVEAGLPAAPDPAEAMRAKTIYDHRRMVQEVAERYAGSLYQALKRMYDAVNERNVLRDGIESVVLADAASVLGRVDAALKGNGEGR
jgi:hypothetical protein